MNNTNKPFKLHTLLIPAVGLGALLASPAGAVEALLAADAHVSASQPATNFGPAEALQVGSGQRALLRFDLASMLPAGTTASQVSKAVLNVWVRGVTTAGSVDVSEILSAWTEAGVTGATPPSAGPAFATKPVPAKGRWMSVVVTNHVKKWLNNPGSNFGLLIAPAATAPNTAVAFDSKENTATSHPPRLDIELTASLGAAYTLTVGKNNATDNTGRSQKAVADFTTITAALNKIPDNVYGNGQCSARYLVKVLPGVYNERVAMKPCVDIEGSGELTTKITAQGGATQDAASATVAGANQAELRFLTVDNTGGAAYAYAIFNNAASPRLTHVTATASGGTHNYGVFNYYYSSPAMAHVTASASGGTNNYGVLNSNSSSPAMTNVTATAAVYGSTNGTNSYGVYNSASSPAMTNVTATASGATASYGVYNSGVSSPAMTNVIISAVNSTYRNYGVYNSASSPAMTNATVTAHSYSGDVESFSVYNQASSPTIHHSILRGATFSLYSSNSTARIGASQLDGSVAGTATCVASYNGSFVALNASCK
jgi:hypothetical protein